jgi:hypothetical protein
MVIRATAHLRTDLQWTAGHVLAPAANDGEPNPGDTSALRRSDKRTGKGSSIPAWTNRQGCPTLSPAVGGPERTTGLQDPGLCPRTIWLGTACSYRRPK